MAAEELRNCLASIAEVRSIDSITEHPRGGFEVVLQVEEGSIGVICNALDAEGYRGVLRRRLTALQQNIAVDYLQPASLPCGNS